MHLKSIANIVKLNKPSFPAWWKVDFTSTWNNDLFHFVVLNFAGLLNLTVTEFAVGERKAAV